MASYLTRADLREITEGMRRIEEMLTRLLAERPFSDLPREEQDRMLEAARKAMAGEEEEGR